MLKVCYATHQSNLTGANRSLLDLLITVKNEVEPIVLLRKKGPIENELRKMGIKYEVIPYGQVTSSGSSIKDFIKRLTSPFFTFKVKRFLKKENVDLVHNNSFLVSAATEAAKKIGVPYICHLREMVEEDHGLIFLNEKKQYKLLNESTEAIAISQFVYEKYFQKAPDANYHILHNGFNIEKYHHPNHQIFQSDSIKVILAGRVTPGKGQLDAVKAFEMLQRDGINNVSLLILGNIGAQSYYDNIKQYIDKHNLRKVEIVSFVDDMFEIQEKADINLVCSVAEAMGRVTIESQLAGCLTIGADAGATPELISDNSTGILYEAGNPDDLASKLKYAVTNIDKMRQIAQNGRDYAYKNYSNEVYAKKVIDIYNRAINA